MGKPNLVIGDPWRGRTAQEWFRWQEMNLAAEKAKDVTPQPRDIEGTCAEDERPSADKD